MNLVPIDDPEDPRVAEYASLVDRDLRRLRAVSGGSEGDVVVAEGALVIRQLLRSPFPVRSVLLTGRGLADLADDLRGAALDVPVYVVPQAIVERITGFHFHRGSLAVAGRLPERDVAEVVGQPGVRIVVVLEGVNDHENVGGVFRNAAAFGAGAVLLDPTTADPLYRRSVRVSMGHVLRVPFARVRPWPAGLGGLAEAGFEVVALTPAGDAVDLGQIEPAGPGRRVALLAGAEGPGLSRPVLAAAGRRARIGLAPGVDSLNVATAVALALHRLAPREPAAGG